jgi:hypothetical protein
MSRLQPWLVVTLALGAAAFLVLTGVLAYRWSSGKGLDAPADAVNTAERFVRAGLAQDCATAWALLSDGQRRVRDEQDFCKRLGNGCATMQVEVTSSTTETGPLILSGRSRCEERLWNNFSVTLTKPRDRWEVEAFADGL